jgi:hypothetical protein
MSIGSLRPSIWISGHVGSRRDHSRDRLPLLAEDDERVGPLRTAFGVARRRRRACGSENGHQ